MEQLLEILGKLDENSEVAQAIIHTLQKLASQSQKAAEILANSGGPSRLIEALRKHPENADLAIDCISSLKVIFFFIVFPPLRKNEIWLTPI